MDFSKNARDEHRKLPGLTRGMNAVVPSMFCQPWPLPSFSVPSNWQSNQSSRYTSHPDNMASFQSLQIRLANGNKTHTFTVSDMAVSGYLERNAKKGLGLNDCEFYHLKGNETPAMEDQEIEAIIARAFEISKPDLIVNLLHDSAVLKDGQLSELRLHVKKCKMSKDQPAKKRSMATATNEASEEEGLYKANSGKKGKTKDQVCQPLHNQHNCSHLHLL